MADEHPTSIQVNNRPVSLPDHKTTGLAIKQAAVAQGVAIKTSFALFRVTGHEEHQVRDDERITVHDGEQFKCVDDDDNS